MNSIPLHILTGFLGVGKTTLLNRLLSQPENRNTLVIVNEFGSISVDHHLIKAAEETLIELSNGCICCSIRGNLAETLLSSDLDNIERVIVETTGVADPLPVLQLLATETMVQAGIVPGRVITVFDCIRGPELIADHPEARHQIALADQIFLSRTDTGGNKNAAVHAIGKINTHAEIVTDPDKILLSQNVEKSSLRKPDTMQPEAGHSYHSLVLEYEHPVPIATIEHFIGQLGALLGSDLLRIKGFGYCLEAEANPVLFQLSGQIAHKPQLLPSWQDERPSTRLAVIFNGGHEKTIRQMFDGFFGRMGIDTPDKDALQNNPLKILGV